MGGPPQDQVIVYPPRGVYIGANQRVKREKSCIVIAIKMDYQCLLRAVPIILKAFSLNPL